MEAEMGRNFLPLPLVAKTWAHDLNYLVCLPDYPALDFEH